MFRLQISKVYPEYWNTLLRYTLSVIFIAMGKGIVDRSPILDEALIDQLTGVVEYTECISAEG